MPELIDHLESRLGRMTGAWSPPAGSPEGVPQVAHFREGRLPGAQSFATVGLSRTPLRHPTTDRHYHLELLACETTVRADGYGPFPDVLDYVSGRLVASGQAILRGDVVPLPIPLPGGTMTSLYAAMPVYFDDDFFSVTVENGSEVVIAWLIPITAEETAFIHEKGWQPFEEALTHQNPDLLNPNRPQLDLP
ncbi:suppressor of fused domain protein [Streptomyces aureus]|uniref:suppressor of fused domain protein n=1 Tax=Streptomyces aureus TaxID=193461 RepID=UPI0033F30AE0